MGRLAWSPALARKLEQAAGDLDVIHSHSLWMLPTHYAARAAARRGVPVVYTTHGFLEPWALAHSRWKKRLAGWAFQDRDLRSAACLVVNSLAELASVRAYGLRNPVAVIPNGVNLEDSAALPPREEFERRCPAVRGQRLCLFLSRLHEKKGLGHLVEAWSRISREIGDWHLVIAGPDDGYEARLRERVAALGLAGSVSVAGPLYGEAKRAAWSLADAFVLPSFSEGFSMAALEALAAGLPALLTPGCNFPEAARDGSAIEVEPTVDGTTNGLRRLLEMSDAERRAMGSRGRTLVESGYTWDAVAARTRAVYDWARGSGPVPADVVFD
jgi:poly(glycerol-phosphate) alpha-glucosyltransferase